MINNSTILNAPIVLFLGAGASNPLEKPLMGEFLGRLGKQIAEDSQAKMLALLRRFRGDDLETILGELDTIIDLTYANSINGFYSHDGGSSAFSLDRNVAKRLRATVKHAIIKEYRNVDDQKTVELYKPLFEILFSFLPKGQCLPIFTTNYDPAIEVFYQQQFSEYELCDGFTYDKADRHNYWNRATFDDLSLDHGKRNLILFKLHGSVDWLFVQSSRRIRRGQAMYDAMDADAYGNVLIYPATRKIATDDPFYTGYEYFQRCCERTQICIAIGYSFRDYDALTRLKGAISLNDKLHLLLVDPFASRVSDNIKIPSERKAPLEIRFGENVSDLQFIKKYLSANIIPEQNFRLNPSIPPIPPASKH